jgi:hypothetical protein
LPTGDYGFSSQQSLWQFVSLPNLCAPGLFLESLARRAFSLVATMSRLWDRPIPKLGLPPAFFIRKFQNDRTANVN